MCSRSQKRKVYLDHRVMESVPESQVVEGEPMAGKFRIQYTLGCNLPSILNTGGSNLD